MKFKRNGKGRTIDVTEIPLHVAGITTAGDTMTVKVSYEGDSSGRVGHTLDNAVMPLIEAAPELLSSLRLAVLALKAHGVDESMAGEFEMLEAAIAKAEGRA